MCPLAAFCFCWLFAFFDVAPCATFAARSDSVFFVRLSLLLSFCLCLLRCSGPDASRVEALLPPLQPLPALTDPSRCHILMLFVYGFSLQNSRLRDLITTLVMLSPRSAVDSN